MREIIFTQINFLAFSSTSVLGRASPMLQPEYLISSLVPIMTVLLGYLLCGIGWMAGTAINKTTTVDKHGPTMTYLPNLSVLIPVDQPIQVRSRLRLRLSSQALTLLLSQPGDGKNFPVAGDRVKIHYVGTLESKDGKKFDSSRDRGKPFECQIGVGKVIKAWDQGVVQLSIGQEAYFKCPPSIAYGAAGCQDVIPPNSTLFFKVELLEINGRKS
ncbi:peptidyl-prolyl cis-trans isomerase [Puccinia sorghi]|uniref:peptidylprolyl isomerase n=1 Tax=Puccinia sorghi TaxID=27349 RepID=A0A0L6VA67_9BASI|nr:peptidyl-prolyl cis-trans isomerase [Puccinia sorghi]